VAGPSDHELIAELQFGRRDALGILFDRYSPQLYEFLYLLTGDREQAARLLEEVFARIPSTLAGLGEHESVRGWLYNQAREATLTYLRQKNWLEALPFSEEPVFAGLPGEIWQAARAMPAFHRAVLIIEELHGLSPTEKARALNVARTDLPRLVEEARRSFNLQFDLQARQQGRPVSAQVDPEHVWGIHRRLGAGGSLFGYLPLVVAPDSLIDAVRARVLSSMRGTPPPERARPVFFTEEIETTEEPELPMPMEELPTPRARRPGLLQGCSVPVVVGTLIIALIITALAACGFIFFSRDNNPPTITRIDPPDKANVPPTAGSATTHIILSASYQDDRTVDLSSVRLVLDGRDVTTQALISNTGITFPVDLDAGNHVVLLELRDPSGNRTSRAWQFTVLPQPGTTPVPTGTPTLTPTIGPTRIPTPTATGTLQLPPVVAAFTANQTTVKPGTPVLLTWSVSGADVVFLNQDKVDPTGTRLVAPTATTVYHLIANNAGGTVDRAITITVQSLPDLTVTDIGVTQTGQITYVIKNIGSGDVTQMFLIQVMVDGIAVDSNRRVSTLPAGQDVSLFVPNYTLVGTHTVTVRVNGQQEIQETNLNNNELTRTVGGPTPTPSNTPTATWTVTNTPTNTPTNLPTATPTHTPTHTPTSTVTPIPFLVTNVTAVLSSTSPYTGTCPGTFSFSGSVTTNGPTNVTYRWERSDTINNGPFSLPFGSAATQNVTFAWPSAPVNNVSNPTSWVRLHVLTPNDMTSSQVFFSNNCH
jgi:DNA-directed RNA polymerase specialized sigma24 family protein